MGRATTRSSSRRRRTVPRLRATRRVSRGFPDGVDAVAGVERARDVAPVVLGEGLEDPGVPRKVLLGKARHDATRIWQGHAEPYVVADRERATEPLVLDEALRGGIDDH